MKTLKHILIGLWKSLDTETPVMSDRWINLSEGKKEEILEKVKQGITNDKEFIVV